MLDGYKIHLKTIMQAINLRNIYKMIPIPEPNLQSDPTADPCISCRAQELLLVSDVHLGKKVC